MVYTAWDMKPFAADVWAELDAAGRERVMARWQECNDTVCQSTVTKCRRRLFGMRNGAPISAPNSMPAIARLYGLTHDELSYIFDPADVYGPVFSPAKPPRIKEKEIKFYGDTAPAVWYSKIGTQPKQKAQKYKAY